MKIQTSLVALLALITPACIAYTDLGYNDHEAAGSSGTGGAAGHGGHGGSLEVCTPGAVEVCYDGPEGTLDVGACKAGSRTCDAAGATWSPCAGATLPAPEDCSLPGDEDCDGIAPTCGGDLVWAVRGGGVEDQRALAVATDAAGNVLVTGFFRGTLGFPGGTLTSAGGADVFVVKLAPTGAYLWGKSFGGPGDQFGASVAVDAAGDVLVTGRFGGSIDFGLGALVSAGGEDVFLVKLDSDGAPLWSKGFGGAGDQWGTAVKADAAGAVVLTGFSSGPGSIDFGAGDLGSALGSSSFLVKLDAAGVAIWSKGLGAQSGALAYDLAVDSAGNALVTGQYSGAIAMDSGPLTSAGAADVFVVKFDPAGLGLWGKSFGDKSAQLGLGIATSAAGDVFITGEFQGSLEIGASLLSSFGGYDIFLAKLDASGAPLWGKRFGLSEDQIGTSLAVDAVGNMILSGQFFGTVDFGGNAMTSAGASDIFLAKLDPSGAHLWSKRFGDAADIQVSHGVAVDPASNVLVTGFFAGAADFGAGPLTSAGSTDSFVAKLAP